MADRPLQVNQLLKLGTRGSPLAVAQSRLVAQALEQQHPEIRVELVLMKTRGDHDTSTPLHQVSDGDFFSDRTDQALLSGEVDICVHSRKDLPSHRPPGITLAATPRTENPRDVVVVNPGVVYTLRAC